MGPTTPVDTPAGSPASSSTTPSTTPPATPGLELAPQQADAVEKVEAWYHNADGAEVFRLFGYAGTGKTTLARHIVDELGLADTALYAAYTGKAAYVLRSKGCDSARTVHSLIYQPVEKVRARLNELLVQLDRETNLAKRAELERAVRVEQAKLDRPNFVLKDESELTGAPLLVLDEVSMVGREMAVDLLSFGVKLLVLGDPAQLPPVEGGGYFINAAPDHLLTEIHRSALDSPVTRLATAIRTSTPGDDTLGIDGADGDSGRRHRIGKDELAGFDQVLVGTNRTRWTLIHAIRRLYGFTEPVPQPGDRIIVLANNHEAGIFNGQLFTVGACRPDDAQPDVLQALVFDDNGEHRMLPMWACGFVDIEGEKQAKRNGRSKIVAATFGQAITCHKAQGSQWDRVLVVDESGVFGAIAYKEHLKALSRDGAAIEAHIAKQRWLYTAVTRAAEQVVLVPGVS